MAEGLGEIVSMGGGSRGSKMSPAQTVNNYCCLSEVKQRNTSIMEAVYNRQTVPVRALLIITRLPACLLLTCRSVVNNMW